MGDVFFYHAMVGFKSKTHESKTTKVIQSQSELTKKDAGTLLHPALRTRNVGAMQGEIYYSAASIIAL